MLSTDVEVVSGEEAPSVEAFIDGFNICGCSFVGVIKVNPLVVEASVGVSLIILLDISMEISVDAVECLEVELLEGDDRSVNCSCTSIVFFFFALKTNLLNSITKVL